MKVAVSGASGHLGQWTVAALQDAGHELTAIARRPLSAPSIAGVGWPGPVAWIACDLASPEAVQILRPALHSAEAVVHLAGHIPEDTSLVSTREALATLRVNAEGTVQLLDALATAPRVRRVVYASSFEVYGLPRATPIGEDHPTRPTGLYGASKLAAEHYVRLFGADRGLACASLRLPAVYGPGDHLRRAVGNFVSRAATGLPPVLRGDGGDRRDLVYVADAAQAILRALESPAEGAINLGSGRGYRILEIAEAVCRIAGITAAPVLEPPAKPALDYVLDTTRARTDLGWEPRTSLEQGLGAQLAWRRASP